MTKLLKSMTNYGIICPSDLLFNVIYKRLVSLNLADGVYPYPSLFGSYLVVSDTDFPSEYTYVISRIERDSNIFTNLDCESQWVDLIMEIEHVSDPDLRQFLKTNTLLNKQSLDDRYRAVLIILYEAFLSEGFNWAIADRIVSGKFSLVFSYSHKVQTVINLIGNPNSQNISEFMKVFPKDEFPIFVSILTQIVEGTLPEPLLSKNKGILGSDSFVKKLGDIVLKLIHIRGYEDFILGILRNV